MIVLDRDINERARLVRKGLGTSVEESKRPACVEIANTRFARIGSSVDPDAVQGGQEPWKMLRTWHERQSKADLVTPQDSACPADGVGGNSSSPVVNRAGELAGLIFDSNIPALKNEFGHSSDVGGRSIAVHVAGMLAAMRHLNDAGNLADELGR